MAANENEGSALHVHPVHCALAPPPPAPLLQAVHTEDALAVCYGERFNFVLCDHLLHSIATSRAQGDVEAYLRGLVDGVMEEGGIALIGAQQPRRVLLGRQRGG